MLNRRRLLLFPNSFGALAKKDLQELRSRLPLIHQPGTTPITILAVNSDHGLSCAGRKLGPWSEFPFLYRFTVLLNSGGSNSPWSEVWSEFPHFMGMGRFPHRQLITGVLRGESPEVLQ